MEHPTIERLYHIHALLKRNARPTTRVMAEVCSINLRTIQRDLVFMVDRLGAPVERDRHGRYYYTDENWELPPVKLTQGELLAIAVGTLVLGLYDGTPYEGEIRKAFDKIRIAIPEASGVELSQIEKMVSFDVKGLRGEAVTVEERFRVLSRGIQECRSVKMEYYAPSTDEVTVRVVDPYHLYVSGGALYFFGHCHLRGALRTFALDRIRAVELTGEKFEQSKGFSVRDYLGKGIGIERGGPVCGVAVRFDARQARWIREREVHESQRLEELPDGSVVLRMTVDVTGELRRWLLSFGSHAEVLEPAWLRAEMAAEAEAMRRGYGAGIGNGSAM